MSSKISSELSQEVAPSDPSLVHAAEQASSSHTTSPQSQAAEAEGEDVEALMASCKEVFKHRPGRYLSRLLKRVPLKHDTVAATRGLVSVKMDQRGATRRFTQFAKQVRGSTEFAPSAGLVRLQPYYDAAIFRRPCAAAAPRTASTTSPVALIFRFYAKLFEPAKQVCHGGVTYDEIQAANETLCFGEALRFARDFRLLPQLMTRGDLQFVWNKQRAGDAELRRENAMRLPQFLEFLCRIALLVYSVPPLAMPGASPEAKVDKLKGYLHLHDATHVRRHLNLVGVHSSNHLAPKQPELTEGEGRDIFQTGEEDKLNAKRWKRRVARATQKLRRQNEERSAKLRESARRRALAASASFSGPEDPGAAIFAAATSPPPPPAPAAAAARAWRRPEVMPAPKVEPPRGNRGIVKSQPSVSMSHASLFNPNDYGAAVAKDLWATTRPVSARRTREAQERRAFRPGQAPFNTAQQHPQFYLRRKEGLALDDLSISQPHSRSQQKEMAMKLYSAQLRSRLVVDVDVHKPKWRAYRTPSALEMGRLLVGRSYEFQLHILNCSGDAVEVDISHEGMPELSVTYSSKPIASGMSIVAKVAVSPSAPTECTGTITVSVTSADGRLKDIQEVVAYYRAVRPGSAAAQFAELPPTLTAQAPAIAGTGSSTPRASSARSSSGSRPASTRRSSVPHSQPRRPSAPRPWSGTGARLQDWVLHAHAPRRITRPHTAATSRPRGQGSAAALAGQARREYRPAAGSPSHSRRRQQQAGSRRPYSAS